MGSNRFHANRPTAYTPADRARQAAALARHDARLARAAAKNRLYRIAYACAVIAVGVALFYSAINRLS